MGVDTRDRGYWSTMYVDDLSIGEVQDLTAAVSHFTTGKELRTVHAKKCEEVFSVITDNANRIGMKINATKTQLLCISDHTSAHIDSYINLEEDECRINSGEEMKVLGFVFGQKPTVNYHLEYTLKKFKKKIWILNHLKKADIDKNTMLQVYMSMLRPVLEFCSPVYHSMISADMNSKLENMQKLALRIIFGFDKKYEVILAENNITTLEERRSQAFDNFAIKCSLSGRFSEWLPVNDCERTLRTSKKYREEYARSSRLYKSPIYAMRRRLNEI